MTSSGPTELSEGVSTVSVTYNKVTLTFEMGVSSKNSIPNSPKLKSSSKLKTKVSDKILIPDLPKSKVAIKSKREISGKNSIPDSPKPKVSSKFGMGFSGKNSIPDLPKPTVASKFETEISDKNSIIDSSKPKAALKIETMITGKNSILDLPTPKATSKFVTGVPDKNTTPGVMKPKAALKFETMVSSNNSIRVKPNTKALKVEIGASDKNSIPASLTPNKTSTAEIVLSNDTTPTSPTVEIRSTPRLNLPRVKSYQMGWAQVVEELSWKLNSMETSGGSESSGGEDAEARRARRGHVLAELMQTERVYVQELGSILSGYKEEIEKPENQHLLPAALVGQADVLFGNLHELFTFHQDVFLKDLEKSISATELVALCFVEKRDTFFRLYSYYCQNIPRSERLRETLVDTHLFLQACQLRLGHKLPLAAYLLKPVQRITKYQLLLKDLLRYGECGSMTTGLQSALDCMLVVLKCVNDSMHQIAITGVPVDLSQQGELLMQGSFLVVSENKRDIRLRIRPRRRHIFLYEKAMLFCKPATKNSHNKATYHFKHDLQMSQIGLTESVKGDPRKFEVWRQGRLEVHTLTAASADVKRAWVERVKRVLLDQLNELKGERVRQYSAQHRTLIQTSSWDLAPPAALPLKPAGTAHAPRAASCDAHDEPCWSTDPSDDEDDDTDHPPVTEAVAVGLNGTIHRMVQFFSVAGSAQATSTFYVSQY